jgi:hypothetical protein
MMASEERPPYSYCPNGQVHRTTTKVFRTYQDVGLSYKTSNKPRDDFPSGRVLGRPSLSPFVPNTHFTSPIGCDLKAQSVQQEIHRHRNTTTELTLQEGHNKEE